MNYNDGTAAPATRENLRRHGSRPRDWNPVEIMSESWNQPGDPALGRSPFPYKTTERSVDPAWAVARYAPHIAAAQRGDQWTP